MTHNRVNQKQNQYALISVQEVALWRISFLHLEKARYGSPISQSCCCRFRACEFPEQSDNHMGKTIFVP
uniref:Phospholipid-transporting ATPase n=1 Tax=Solanum tuberosum TaxID=4113 RepID=M1C295_SOLTU